ncbi:MAG: TonB-dependent receptor plug domain-containing protein, partial [Woeseiaceae bacterium]|nr:TonB-dependent receptor plug domain-containing protein [Woeseiaceae bacterium]
MNRKNSLANPAVTGPAIAMLASLSLAAPLSAFAQTRVLEEITVTAQKREQSLQDTAVAVTALSGDDLAANGVIDIARLDTLAPGLQLGQSGNDPRPAMRGARTQQVEANDVAVAFYTDGLYRPRHGQALAGFVDISRVEVLRGPQGTLFGRNSLGGLIHVVSNKPEYDATDYGFALTGGDFSQARGEGFFNVPMGDSAALRVAAVRETRDPYVSNTELGDSGGLKDADTSYIRGQLAFAPSDTFDVTFRAEYWK